jgi:hypothetical protein
MGLDEYQKNKIRRSILLRTFASKYTRKLDYRPISLPNCNPKPNDTRKFSVLPFISPLLLSHLNHTFLISLLGHVRPLLIPLLLPHHHATNPTESKQDTQCDAESPDGFHLKAGGARGASPNEVVHSLHVGSHRGEERGCCSGGAEGLLKDLFFLSQARAVLTYGRAAQSR